MLKFKSPVTKLSSAIALVLFTGAASATTVGDTTMFPPDYAETLHIGDWAAGYFFVNNQACPNGCDITGASLLIAGEAYPALDPSAFSEVKLEIFSNQSNQSGPNPGNSLFQMTTPSTVTFNGNFGTYINFTAPAQNPNVPALLQPQTAYWLKLTNVGQTTEFGWFFDGVNKSGQYWASSQYGQGAGSPFIFKVTGDQRLAAPPLGTPIPSTIWMMGSALIGVLAAGRRKKPN